MRYQALICDYDGTIAHHGKVGAKTIAALERLVASGRRLVLVTGRERSLLERDFDRIDLFDRIVVENGAVLYDPGSHEDRLLTEPADERLVAALRGREVAPLSVGMAIVATCEPHDAAVLDAIRELGFELEIIFNKGAVMILPTGITKASGLQAALLDLGLSAHNAVGVGDAENDHAFLSLCGLSAAVANALPALKERADIVLERDHGAGVEQLIDRLLDDDLRSAEPSIGRLAIEIGTTAEGSVSIAPRDRVLLAGPSGSGKSTLVLALIETLADRALQFVLVDPEGDYEHVESGVRLGTSERAPSTEETAGAMADPTRSVVVNLLGEAVANRPARAGALLSRVQELRARTGRPHWLIFDEAHHLLPAAWHPAPDVVPREVERSLGVTVHPGRLAPTVLEAVDVLLVVGSAPRETVGEFATAARAAVPDGVPNAIDGDQAILWRIRRGRATTTSLCSGRPNRRPNGGGIAASTRRAP